MNKMIYHGAAYYPELWSSEVVNEDLRLMKETGINVIRIAEFAWSHMEPEENEIDVTFFEDIINRFYSEGISTVMCTPTVTPPIWLSHGHPERMYVNHEGKTMVHGSREHVCINNAYYRERSRKIVAALSKVVGSLPGVIAWQIHNELNWPVRECFCETCRIKWHASLERKYLKIEALNEAWGTGVWSHTYQRFDQVPQPGPTPYLHSGSLTTAYRRFNHESVASYLHEQVEIIRQYSDRPITHNTNRLFYLDNEMLLKHLDFAAFDEYATSDNYQEFLLNYDLWRSAKPGKRFWVMETSTSYSGSIMGTSKPHPDGYLVAEAVSAFALGAEGFNYWLWRQQRSGAEMLHGSVISSWGGPSIGYKDVLKVTNALKQLESILLNSDIKPAEIAMTYSDRARAFLLTETMGETDYHQLSLEWYKSMLEAGFHRDVIMENSSLDSYKVIMTPYVPYLSQKMLDDHLEFVKTGGVWIIGPLTGYRTEEHTVHTDFALGELETWAGVEVEAFYPSSHTGAVGCAFGEMFPLTSWSLLMRPVTAKVMGGYEGGKCSGTPFITERLVGKGKIVLLGAKPDGAEGCKLIGKLIRHYAAEQGVKRVVVPASGTIAVERTLENAELCMVINMDGYGGSVQLEKGGVNVLTGKNVEAGALHVSPYEYQVIQFIRD